MVSTVTSKPNHYQRLGLAPDAGDTEIARAFAVAMSPLMPRTVGDIAEIALAFETLRDPVKRRAYDQSIAPEPEPEPEPEVESEPNLMFPREGWPFTASARIGSAELPAIDELPRAAPKAEPEPFIASPPPPQRVLEPQVEVRRPAVEDRFRFVEQAPMEWKRPAAMVAAVFGGVALLGAGLGWYASRGISPAQAEQAATFQVPRAEAPVAEPLAPAPKQVKAFPERRTRPAAAPARARPASPPPEPALSEEKRAEDVPDIPSEQVAALASQVEEAPAAMPLPDAVVARTIRRIGYACGEVTSTSAVDGSPGVFKVTCASGDTYKAAPVRGRYHFRRWGGN